jgi:predicted HTH transcriptional regulator
MLPFPFPNLENCTVFPLVEGTNLEFKIGFNSSMAEKIIATICGILNSGGGYLVIGIEDGTRKIIGIKSDKQMDNFLLMLDSIHHHKHIKLLDGTPIPVGSIASGIVPCADNKDILVVTINAQADQQYTVKDGSVWYRLAASNFKQTKLPNMYTESEMELIIQQRLTTQAKILQQQYDIERKTLNQKFRAEHDKVKSRFSLLETDFRKILGAAKGIEKNLDDFKTMIYNDILIHKSEAELELEREKENKRRWFSVLCC